MAMNLFLRDGPLASCSDIEEQNRCEFFEEHTFLERCHWWIPEMEMCCNPFAETEFRKREGI